MLYTKYLNMTEATINKDMLAGRLYLGIPIYFNNNCEGKWSTKLLWQPLTNSVPLKIPPAGSAYNHCFNTHFHQQIMFC